jgi:hypothetical protein
MNIPFRTVTVHASALLIVAACAAACSSAPDGTGEPAAQSTEQALSGRPTCAKGYIAVSQGWDTLPNGQPIQSWACEANATAGVHAATYAGTPASGYSDTCGSTAVPTPASLPLTCTLGTIIDGQYFFACPAGIALPQAPLGLVNTNETCTPPVLGDTCESVTVVTSLVSNCLGSPVAGWELVVDALDAVHHDDGGMAGCGPTGCGGACPGGCTIDQQAPLGRAVAP